MKNTISRQRLDVRGAAQYVGVSKSLLDKMRTAGVGPDHFRVGARVVYDATHLDAWLESKKVRCTAQPADTPRG